jgi:hypothetical protein
VRGPAFERPHLVELDVDAALRRLPCRLAAREAGADNAERH